MKKLSTLILGLFLIVNAEANHNNSQLNLRLYDNALFTVSIDKMNYANPSTSFNSINITPGNHYIKVVKHIFNPYSYWGNSCITVFQGCINMPAGREVFAQIDAYNTFNVYNQVPLHRNHGNNYYSNNNCGNENDYYGNPGGDNGCYNKPAPCYGMTPAAFHKLKMVLANTAFSSTKLQIAKQAIAANKVSAEQVEELMHMMDFESDKLGLAKFAYLYTVDRNNYYAVNEAFDFDSSIHELNRYISMI